METTASTHYKTMKISNRILTLIAAISCGASQLPAAIIVPGANGTDGALNVTENTVIDLSLAPTGVWDADNTANAGNGIYDPAKWAVVFKYSSVNVAAGATVTFKNNASRAPVVWLVSGNVTISGTVSLDGQNHAPEPLLAEPGPGGFRGGAKYYVSSVTGGAGFGVGGGARVEAVGLQLDTIGAGGSYGVAGGNGRPPYGNPSLVPLVGGSGGGSASNFVYGGIYGGGGGGGAICMACQQSIQISGSIRANGGFGAPSGLANGGKSGSGSGGGIRIVSDILSGNGSILANGGSSGIGGGAGRVRIERVINSATIVPTPDPSVVDLAPSATALLWPPTSAPEVKVLSVGDTNAPADPKAGFGTFGADVALPSASTTTVIIETTNVEAASTVKVRATPRSGANFSEVDATPTIITNSPLVIHWTASVAVATGYNAVQARVIRP